MIIAIKEKDKVVIGYSLTDSWGGLCDKDYVDEENLALTFLDTGNVFGFADGSRRADILLYDDDFLKMEITPKNIVKEVIPYIKNKLKENDKPIDEDGYWRNALVICNNEHIYDIDPRFGFFEADDYVCHGYKTETLKSVLDDTKNLSAVERIIKAVNFASQFHRENFFPLIITDTKERKITIYQSELQKEMDTLDKLCNCIVNRANRCQKTSQLGASDVIVKNEQRMLQEAINNLVEYYEGEKRK